MAACGCFGTSAITALTAQNTLGVWDIHSIPVNHIRKQIESVLDDIGTNAIKIGMLHTPEVIQTVKDTLQKYKISNIVVDPVMVATSGDRLLLEESIETLKNELVPIAKVITPNIPEAEILLNDTISTPTQLPKVAHRLSQKYSISVLLKGGHLKNEDVVDVLYDWKTKQLSEFTTKRVFTKNTHGTGCTLSSALACFLAKGFPLSQSVHHAKNFLNKAIQAGSIYTIGKGYGPVKHHGIK